MHTEPRFLSMDSAPANVEQVDHSPPVFGNKLVKEERLQYAWNGSRGPARKFACK